MPTPVSSRRTIAVLVLLVPLLVPLTWAQADSPPTTTALTPAELVDAILANNVALSAARADRAAARARITPAGALDDPMLSTMVAPRTFNERDMDPAVGIEISQRIPWPGKRALRQQIATFEAEAVARSVPQVRLDLTRLAREGYADWYLVHAAMAVNDENRALWRDVIQIAEQNYASGRGTQQEALQTDMELQALDHRRVVLERQRSEILAELNRLLNRPADAPLPAPAPLKLATIQPPSQPLAALRALAIERRTELAAAEAELRSDNTAIELAQRDYFPDFQVSAGYNSMWADEEMRWTVGVGVNLPLGRGKRDAALSEAKAEAIASRWRLQDLSLEIGLEVDRAHARMLENHHLLGLHADKLLPLAKANLEAARTAYESRTGSLESLLRAQRGLLETQLNYETARADYYRSMAALERAVGGFDSAGLEAAAASLAGENQ